MNERKVKRHRSLTPKTSNIDPQQNYRLGTVSNESLILRAQPHLENYRKENSHKVTKGNGTKTPLKPRLRTSIFKRSPRNRLHKMLSQSGVVSSTKEIHTLNQRESVKLKMYIKKGKARAKGSLSDLAQSEFI